MRKKDSRLLWVCGILVLFLSISVYSEGVYEAWVGRYNGPGNYSDYAQGIAVDDSGNVYVVGNSLDLGISIVTIKYGVNGDIIWLREYKDPAGYGIAQAYAIQVDISQNVYITGGCTGPNLTTDFLTLKYSPNGDSLWARLYNGADGGSDWASDLALSNNGEVCVTGRSQVGLYSWDYATVNYSSDGDMLWARAYNGPSSLADYCEAIAIDSSGNVYVTGASFDTLSGLDYATIKYSSTGEELWVSRYNGPEGYDVATDLALDGEGNIYVTGTSNGGSTSEDCFTMKYTPSGDTLWTARYNGPMNLIDRSVALGYDTSGYIFLTGETQDSGVGSFGLLAIKLALGGQLLWAQTYSWSDSTVEFARAMSVDGHGNLYVLGYSISSDTSRDYVTIKYNSQGQELWVREYDGIVLHGFEDPVNLVTDEEGNVIVTGWSNSSTSGPDYLTVKYTPCADSSPTTGDANADSILTIADVIATAYYIFNDRRWPECPEQSGICWLSGEICRGDWNGNRLVTLVDVIQGANYIFGKSGGQWNPVLSGACCLPVP